MTGQAAWAVGAETCSALDDSTRSRPSWLSLHGTGKRSTGGSRVPKLPGDEERQ
jgi:hypothetical protein